MPRTRGPAVAACTAFALLMLSAAPAAALDVSVDRQFSQLMQERKYLSAYRLVERLDPQNLDPSMLARKADALLKGQFRIADPALFYLRDGAADQSGSVEGATAFRFPLLQALRDAVVAWPKNAALWSQLGDYHFAVFRHPQASPDQQDASADAALDAYLQANQNGAGDAGLLDRIGILYTWREDLEQAAAFLRAAVALQDKSAEYNYDLAYALFLGGDNNAALPYAQFAKDNARGGQKRLNALLLYADVQMGLQNAQAAAPIYEELYAAEPQNLYPLRRVIECNLIGGDTAALERHTRQYIETNPADASSFSRLTNLFLQYQKPGLLISIYHSLEVKYQRGKPEVAGLMAFYEAMLYAGNDQTKEAVDALNQAKRQLFGVYSDDHPINQQIRELNQRLRQ